MAINIKPQNRGKLHATLHVPPDQPIPAAKLNQALHSASPVTRKRAQFARNAKGFKHRGASAKAARVPMFEGFK